MPGSGRICNNVHVHMQIPINKIAHERSYRTVVCRIYISRILQMEVKISLTDWCPKSWTTCRHWPYQMQYEYIILIKSYDGCMLFTFPTMTMRDIIIDWKIKSLPNTWGRKSWFDIFLGVSPSQISIVNTIQSSH